MGTRPHEVSHDLCSQHRPTWHSLPGSVMQLIHQFFTETLTRPTKVVVEQCSPAVQDRHTPIQRGELVIESSFNGLSELGDLDFQFAEGFLQVFLGGEVLSDGNREVSLPTVN